MALLLIDKLDVQLFTTSTQSGAAAAGDDTGAQSGGNGQREALAVVSVKCFALKRRAVRLGQQRYAAVRQRAVNVHQQDENLFSSSCQFRWDLLSSVSQFLLLLTLGACSLFIAKLSLFAWLPRGAQLAAAGAPT